MPSSRHIRDLQGRDVLLDVERWEHIVDGHPELGHVQEGVLRAVESPTEVVPGRSSPMKSGSISREPDRVAGSRSSWSSTGRGAGVSSLHSDDEGSHERDDCRHHL